MRYDYEWPLRCPDPALQESLEIALDYLQRTGQAGARDGTDRVVAAAIMDAWSHSVRHPLRLANAGILAVEQAPRRLPGERIELRVRSMRGNFFDG